MLLGSATKRVRVSRATKQQTCLVSVKKTSVSVSFGRLTLSRRTAGQVGRDLLSISFRKFRKSSAAE